MIRSRRGRNRRLSSQIRARASRQAGAAFVGLVGLGRNFSAALFVAGDFFTHDVGNQLFAGGS